MSLITRCPACSTMFKVVPDQLRVSDGWVRCGQCDEVFDANAHLQNLEDIRPPEPVEQVVPDPFSWGDSLEVDVVSSQPTIELDFPEALGPAPSKQAAPEVFIEPFVDDELQGDVLEPESAATPVPEEAPDAKDPLDAMLADDLVSSIPGIDETVLLSHSELGPMSEVQSDLQSDPPLDEPPEPTPQFLKSERSLSRQPSRVARIVVALLCLFSACTLLLQWVVQERDRIAATEPATLAVLEPLCSILDCRITPLRQIEAVVIDSSSFAKTQADVYRLGFAVKSTALVDVAVPSLELTLTDAQDRAVVRRVLTPKDLGAQRPTLSSGIEWTGSVPVAVKLPADAERIAGYRLLAFYP